MGKSQTIKTAAALLLVLASQASAQVVELPPEVKGPVGGFITVKPVKLEGKTVRYVPLDDGLAVFPAELLSDPTVTVVSSSKAGRFRLLAYTAQADKPSAPALTTVVVGDPAPPPGPNPTPPGPTPPPPGPADTLADALRGIYGGLVDDQKAAKAAILAGAFRQAAVFPKDSQIQTAGALYGAIRSLSVKLTPSDLLPIRERIMEEIQRILPSDPSVVLTQANRDQAAALFSRIATILEGLR